MIKRNSLVTFFVSFLLTTATGCGVFSSDVSAERKQTRPERAEELAESGEYEAAVKEYLRHIDDRLKDSRRPEKENPYFYYLLIGDTELKAGHDGEAKSAYLTAKSNGVENEFISDRLRQLARWYADRNKYDAAFSLLQENREVDPLAFDAETDSVHRKMIEFQDQKR